MDLIAIGLVILLLVVIMILQLASNQNFKKKYKGLKNEFDQLGIVVRRNQSINLSFPVTYKTYVIDKDRDYLFSTSEHSFVPVIPQVGQKMSFDAEDGYWEAIVSSIHYHREQGSDSIIIIYVKDIKKGNFPISEESIINAKQFLKK